MTARTFEGVYPAMCTPFHDDGSIDFESLRTDAQRLEAAGVDGLVPMGSTGESATVSHDEHVEVVEAVIDAVEDVPVIAGTGSNNTKEALALSQRAVDAGADALLLISPYYNKPEQRGFLEHYETIADAVPVPQIVYNVPSRTGQNIEAGTVAELAQHPKTPKPQNPKTPKLCKNIIEIILIRKMGGSAVQSAPNKKITLYGNIVDGPSR
jgi:4-hydroxy-tetrahydrodipicolinate synthase